MMKIALAALAALVLTGCPLPPDPVEEGRVTKKENGRITLEADGNETTHDDLPEDFYDRVQVGDTVEISDDEYGIEWPR